MARRRRVFAPASSKFGLFLFPGYARACAHTPCMAEKPWVSGGATRRLSGRTPQRGSAKSERRHGSCLRQSARARALIVAARFPVASSSTPRTTTWGREFARAELAATRRNDGLHTPRRKPGHAIRGPFGTRGCRRFCRQLSASLARTMAVKPTRRRSAEGLLREGHALRVLRLFSGSAIPCPKTGPAIN